MTAATMTEHPTRPSRQERELQWGGCSLIPLPGDQYTAAIGSAESNGPRGCVDAISYSSFGQYADARGRHTWQLNGRHLLETEHAGVSRSPNMAGRCSCWLLSALLL
jgi:hypothetical protein